MKENNKHHVEVPEDEVSAMREFPVSFSIFSVARSHRGLAAQLLREAGLYPGQEIVLMQLWHQDHRSQNSLCRSTRLDHSTIAKSVRRLEDAGLVISSRSEEDKRVTIVSLTQAGRDIERRVNDAWSKVEALTTEALTEDEQMTFVTLARKIAASLEAAEE